MTPVQRPLPKRPVLDWADFIGARQASLPSIADLPHRQLTTSGRAAVYHALKLANPAPGGAVLVPTYHCPTMIAPVVLLGLEPIFYPINAQGLPALELISDADARHANCLLAPHYFGITQSFAHLRQWCDATNTLLIEDCAHAFYGMAGERPVGAWGDYAITSLTKFFPILEGGLLASASRPIPALSLAPQTLKAELKAAFDISHMATAHGRLKGLGLFIDLLRGGRGRNAPKRPEQTAATAPPPDPAPTTSASMHDSDMARVNSAPLRSTRWLTAHLPQQQACTHRQRLFARYADALSALPGARALHAELPANTAPYAFPLWVDDAERVYHTLRIAGVPVYRWDRRWPGTPHLTGDQGPLWSTHVLQLLCHQSLTEDEADWAIATIRRTLLNNDTPHNGH